MVSVVGMYYLDSQTTQQSIHNNATLCTMCRRCLRTRRLGSILFLLLVYIYLYIYNSFICVTAAINFCAVSNVIRLPVLILAPQPICCNLWAHWVGYIYSLLMLSFQTRRSYFWTINMLIDDMYAVYPSYLSPFPTNGHKQKPTIAPLFYYLSLQYTLFVKISLYFPSIFKNKFDKKCAACSASI